MSKLRATLAALAMLSGLSALSCRRAPLVPATKDAGSEVAGPSVGDARSGDVPPVDVPADVPTEVAAEAGEGDGRDADDASDATGDVLDAGDAGPAFCPAGVAPLDVCGCGCCGEAMGRACWYPSRGETRDAIPNPTPPPTNCALAGCSAGVRHVCCADPGARPGADIICAIDTSDEDFPRFTVTRRVGDVCTTLELSRGGARLPITGPVTHPNANAWRAPCDGSTPKVFAIGGLGSVTPGTAGTRYDVHVVLFFDNGTGIADAVRIDRDEIAVGPSCNTGCQPCGGVCTFDARYTYGYENPRPVAYAHQVILTPPASFVHWRSPRLTMPADMGCGPAIPACGGDALDVADVMAAIADPDVQEALERSKGAGTIPLYGSDPRTFDGSVFSFARDGGGGGSFLVGGQCSAAPTPSPCMEIPAGITRLVPILTAFDQQQLADPSCAPIRP